MVGHAGSFNTVELEEVPMEIVGALDVLRRQITFKTLEPATGESPRADQPGRA